MGNVAVQFNQRNALKASEKRKQTHLEKYTFSLQIKRSTFSWTYSLTTLAK